MNEKLKKLLDALIASGKDFSLDNDQSEIRIWLEDWCLVMDSSGKWKLE